MSTNLQDLAVDLYKLGFPVDKIRYVLGLSHLATTDAINRRRISVDPFCDAFQHQFHAYLDAARRLCWKDAHIDENLNDLERRIEQLLGLSQIRTLITGFFYGRLASLIPRTNHPLLQRVIEMLYLRKEYQSKIEEDFLLIRRKANEFWVDYTSSLKDRPEHDLPVCLDRVEKDVFYHFHAKYLPRVAPTWGDLAEPIVEIVRQAMKDIPYERRRVLELHYGLDGEAPKTFPEIAALLDHPHGQRCRNLARTALEELEDKTNIRALLNASSGIHALVKETSPMFWLLSQRLQVLQLEPKTQSTLLKHNFRILAELVCKTEEQIANLDGLSKYSARKIAIAVLNLNLNLGMSVTDHLFGHTPTEVAETYLRLKSP